MASDIRVLAKSHHRNGVGGEPFNVYLFTDKEQASVFVAVDFDGMYFAVLNVDKLSKGDIAFGSNSWRGDHYADAVREAANKVKDNIAPNSLFVKYVRNKQA